jgi:hypothetical protein
MVPHVVRDIAVQVADHLAPRPPPAAVHPREPVPVTSGEDRLQREVRQRLQDGDVRPRGSGTGPLVDLHDQVGGQVLGPRQPVVQVHMIVDPATGGCRARIGAMPLPVLELRRELVELPGVEQFAIAVHQRRDLRGRVSHARRSSRDAQTIPADR